MVFFPFSSLKSPLFSFSSLDVFKPQDHGNDFLNQLKLELKKVQNQIQNDFLVHQEGFHTLSQYCSLMDQIVTRIYQVALSQHHLQGKDLTLVAIGGYGRSDMAPSSDLDLLFLSRHALNVPEQECVKYILYTLWDLGLNVGHATRTLDECLKISDQDHQIKTSLLENRYICGDLTLHENFHKAFIQHIFPSPHLEFVHDKLEEYEKRHNKENNSCHIVEPNIKNGQGGLRDLHTLSWIHQYLDHHPDQSHLKHMDVYSPHDLNHLKSGQKFLWKVRCSLHYVAQRAEERLIFDLQPEMASMLGYKDGQNLKGVELFMKDYHHHTRKIHALTHRFCTHIKMYLSPPKFSHVFLHKHYIQRQGQITFNSQVNLKKEPWKVFEIFFISWKNDRPIHAHALKQIQAHLKDLERLIPQCHRSRELFLTILCATKQPGDLLRQLNSHGLLSIILPEFIPIIGLMQYDRYHHFTVDEHTLLALNLLSKLDKSPEDCDHNFAAVLINQISNKKILYLSVLLHDIGKGQNADHCVLGHELAKNITARLHLSSQECALISWLVQAHLWMSHTAFKRDLNHPETIYEFAKLIQSPEKLRLLLILTIIDIQSVGPNIWNEWKSSLLMQLYTQTLHLLMGMNLAKSQESQIKNIQNLCFSNLSHISEEMWDTFVCLHDSSYWLHFPVETIANHAHLIIHHPPPHIFFQYDDAKSILKMTIYHIKAPRLFSNITGAIALTQSNIVEAKIHTTNNGHMLFVFHLQTNDPIKHSVEEKKQHLEKMLKSVFSHQLNPQLELKNNPPNTRAQSNNPPHVFINNHTSQTHTLIEINTNDRYALLHDISVILDRMKLRIYSAHISTYGDYICDVLYIKDQFGMKLYRHKTFLHLQSEIKAVLR